MGAPEEEEGGREEKEGKEGKGRKRGETRESAFLQAQERNGGAMAASSPVSRSLSPITSESATALELEALVMLGSSELDVFSSLATKKLMATRNQTALFKKYRDALRNVRPGPSVAGRGSSIELTEVFPGAPQRGRGYSTLSTEDDSDPTRAGSISVSLPPAWVDISDEVSTEMNKVKSKMAELAKSHGRALMVSFDDNTGEQQTIELLTAEITRSLKKCEQKLQRLSGGQGNSGDENLRKNVQRSLATDLQSLSMDFRKLQKGYLGKLRLQEAGQSGADISMGFSQQRSREDDDEFSDVMTLPGFVVALKDQWSSPSDILVMQGFSTTQLSQLKQNEAMSAEREREITQIVESVNDLAQIMKDLSVLVIDQGTIVDRIDYNITNVSASVEQGVRELVKAEETQKKGGMVLCVMVLIALCAFMLFVYIMKKILF
ncbi:hypothetical protein AXG93_3102s1270 [Marchantia polymorpha subsp. ruderalis]|uniref:t-SNARE coiled-coil homology domain-containing protein n=1 Tax=Marchantia polymorpha subsp. ruderalis TaxID=1480154 RepID=A0A176W9Q5_MARPO|nr:hypothetical protein AXG93_3102s1270 [Marchantia polymorpha subsp. ruderalis]